MPEIRLIDADGYTVPGTVQTVSEDTVAKTTEQLLTVDAPQDAAQWADFGRDARDYRVA